jgi:lipopolysaccharide biosynthesis glycosyltransferase
LKTCIALICDLNYLLYALVCATQARKYAPPGTRIAIFLDAPSDARPRIARVCEITRLQIEFVPPEITEKIAFTAQFPGLFRASHVSRSAFLRLMIADLVNEDTGRILYLDCDTQVKADLSELLNFNLLPGRFLAVRDWKAYQSHEGMPESGIEQARLAALGFGKETRARYFNSGVILADIQTWREIGREALDYAQKNPDNCHCQDQCALNAIGRERVQLVSPRWNYLRAFMDLPAYAQLKPAIVHFAAPPKPWSACLPPWGQDGYEPYEDMYASLRGLGLVWERMSVWRQMKWRLKRYIKPEFGDPAYSARMQSLLLQDETPA